MFAEFIGGRLNGVLMWLPMGQDLLSDPQERRWVLLKIPRCDIDGCLVIRFCLGKRDEVAAVHETYFGGELLAALQQSLNLSPQASILVRILNVLQNYEVRDMMIWKKRPRFDE